MKKILTAAILTIIMGASGCGQTDSQNNNKTVDPSSSESVSEMMDTSSQALKEEQSSSYRIISAEDAWKLMESKTELVILDVRTKEEYETSHIPGAVLLPNEEIGTTAPPELPEKDAKILVYCRSGRRSAQAAQKLADLGYTDVSDFGGINSWPYDTESGPDRSE